MPPWRWPGGRHWRAGRRERDSLPLWRLYGVALGVYLRSAPGYVTADAAVTAVSGLVPVAAAWATKSLIDGLTAHRYGDAGLLALAVAGCGAVGAVLPSVTQYLGQEIQRRVTLSTLERLFTAITRFPGLAELEDPVLRDRLQLAQQAAETAPRQLFTSLLASGQCVVTLLGFVTELLTISPLSTALVLGSGMPALIAQSALARRRARMEFRLSPRIRRQLFYASLLSDLRAAKEIRMLGIGSFLCGRMISELRASQAGERSVDKATVWTDTSFAVLGAVVAGAAIMSAVAGIVSGHGSIGDLAVVSAALIGLQTSLSGIVTQMAMAHHGLMLFGHYTTIVRLAARPARADVPGLGHAAARTPGTLARSAEAPTGAGRPAGCPRLLREIEFRDVWFRYHEGHDWVLRGVTLRLPVGTSLALVGRNGSGKSTLVKLLCRFYEPDRGVIRWDGCDIREMQPPALRERMSAVFQDFMSYDLTARENIGLGDLSALGDVRKLRKAAAWAGVDETLSRLPRGYDTMLTRLFADEPDADGDERLAQAGVVLSGGQWQRIALARAVLRHDADLLILDEPSSGLDPHAEAELHARLGNYRSGGTSLLISHRLNAVRDADSIAVLDNGRIAEQGDHSTLMERGGIYADMFSRQALGYQLEGQTAGTASPHPADRSARTTSLAGGGGG